MARAKRTEYVLAHFYRGVAHVLEQRSERGGRADLAQRPRGSRRHPR